MSGIDKIFGIIHEDNIVYIYPKEARELYPISFFHAVLLLAKNVSEDVNHAIARIGKKAFAVTVINSYLVFLVTPMEISDDYLKQILFAIINRIKKANIEVLLKSDNKLEVIVQELFSKRLEIGVIKEVSPYKIYVPAEGARFEVVTNELCVKVIDKLSPSKFLVEALREAKADLNSVESCIKDLVLKGKIFVSTDLYDITIAQLKMANILVSLAIMTIGKTIVKRILREVLSTTKYVRLNMKEMELYFEHVDIIAKNPEKIYDLDPKELEEITYELKKVMEKLTQTIREYVGNHLGKKTMLKAEEYIRKLLPTLRVF